MKKILAIVLTALMILCAFAGCESTGDSSSASGSTASDSNTSSDIDLKSYVDSSCLEWTADDWSMAGDQDKVECALAYEAYKISVDGGSDEDYASAVENLSDILSDNLTVLGEIFTTMADEGYNTLKEAVDAGYEPEVSSEDAAA